MMRYGRGVLVLTVCLAILCLLRVPEARSAELSITGGTVAVGEFLTVTLMADTVDNLAGLKVVIDYDPSLISYRGGAKTQHTDAMMHVINDRAPGRLILVMAAATGISGKNLPLFTFTFRAREDVAARRETILNIADVEMMSETLHKINAVPRADAIVIVPE